MFWNDKDKIVYHSNNGYPKYNVDDKIKYNGDIYVISKLEKFGYCVFGVDGGECTEIGYNAEIKEIPFIVDEMKPFDEVLVRMGDDSEWCCDFFSCCKKSPDGKNVYITILNNFWAQCVPYNESTKHLLCTRINYDGKYKTW